MYQDFSAPSSDSGNPDRILALRELLKELGVHGFLVPRADEHQGEYVPASAERLSWLTGFTGSAGIAAVLQDKAALFVDGRYTVQVRNQIASDIIKPVHSAEQSLGDWLLAHTQSGDTISYDPWLHPIREIEQLSKKLANQDVNLAPHTNLVDKVWHDRPSPPLAPVTIQPIEFSGLKSSDKILGIKKKILKMDATAFLITQPDSLCWLFNIRGQDVPHTPLALAFAIIPADSKPTLFIHPQKLSQEVQDYLEPLANLARPDQLLDHLAEIKGSVALDPGSAAMVFKIHVELSGGHVIHKTDPCLLPKARKNDAELRGAREAHKRDGAAMCRFLCWLSGQEIASLDEIKAARQLEKFRIEAGEYDRQPLRDISFDTISGFGANGAIVHYRVTEATNQAFSPNQLYLIDSGGQYQDGTTDITRTIAIGEPTDQMRRHFTLVLKGMIAISRVRFPKGTSGAQLDVLARVALWQAGCDFDHGTGHGVGSFLSVHEGPQRLSKLSTQPLEEGMILSNEPGYYRTGSYGIRIENLIVVNAPEAINGGERDMMGFETLTFVPIDRNLINTTLLSADELDWLNAYHQRVYDIMAPRLLPDETDWLKAMTAKLVASSFELS